MWEVVVYEKGYGGAHGKRRASGADIMKWRRDASTSKNIREDTGGRGGITQGVSFEFFEFFLIIYSHNTHWVNFEFFQKLLTTLIKTYPQGNFRN